MGSILLLTFGYFLGALPFAVALAAANGMDPAREYDLHAALQQRLGWLPAMAAVAVDSAKGVFPVLIGFGFSLSPGVISMAGLAAVVGQMWPPLRGHGVKGNSTGAGALIALALVYQTYVVLLALAFFALGVAIKVTTMSSEALEHHDSGHPLSLALPLCMLLGFIVAPVFSWLSGAPHWLTIGLALILGAITAKRLTTGLKVDLLVGASVWRVLVRRWLFDQSLAGRDS